MLSPRRPMLLTSLGKYTALKWQGLRKGFTRAQDISWAFLGIGLSSPASLRSLHSLTTCPFHTFTKVTLDVFRWIISALATRSNPPCLTTVWKLLQLSDASWFIVLIQHPRNHSQNYHSAIGHHQKPENKGKEMGRVFPSLITPSHNTCPWDGIGISTGASPSGSPSQGDLTGIKSMKNVRFLPSYATLMLRAASQGKSMNTLNQGR